MRALAAAALVLVLAAAACGRSGSASKGDASHGSRLFAQKCASCHRTGGIAPVLAGAQLPVATAKGRIDGGGSGMPAGIVGGQDEADVLAYLARIRATK